MPVTEKQFVDMVAGGEQSHVDFKLQCRAFMRSMCDNGELAKDICALANNGNRRSFLVIGVSNDGQHFQSVSNSQLTDDNLQSFCKTAVSPPPQVKLFRKKWSGPGKPYSDVELVFVQVGPQPRQAFRLGKDFVDWQAKCCHRRNEVWLRRGATSDLATPEEIALLVAGKDPFAAIADPGSVYSRLPWADQSRAITDDLVNLAPGLGAEVTKDVFGNPRRLVVNLAGKSLVLRVVIMPRCQEKFCAWWQARNEWQYEHGILLVSPGPVAERAFPDCCLDDTHSKESWGRFVYYQSGDVYTTPLYTGAVPADFPLGPFVILAIPNVRSTAVLANALGSVLRSLREERPLQDKVLQCRHARDEDIAGWLTQGLFRATGTFVGGGNENRRRVAADLPEGQILERAARSVLAVSKKPPPPLPET